MNKKKKLFIIIFGVLAVIYIIIANYFGHKRTKQEFLEFDNSKIDGVLKDVYIKHHGVGFKITNVNEEFIFYPYSSELNDNKIFDHLAKGGDRIIKSQNSDTLILISNDKEYKYTFQQFGNK
jgi:hypothetical protein